MKRTEAKGKSHVNKGFDTQLRRKILSAISDSESPYIVEEICTEKLNLLKEKQKMLVRLKQPTLTNSKSTQSISDSSNISNSLSVSMIYQNKPIGEIEIALSDQGMDIKQVRKMFEHIAMDIALFVKRHQARHRLEVSKQLDLQWIGESDSLKKVEQFIEKVSYVDFPVLIHGKSGSGKLLTAYSIHCHSARKAKPFIESHCINWKSNETPTYLQNLLLQANGGTLFLRDIDMLSDEQISTLKHCWRHLFNTIKQANKLHPPSVRLIASTSKNYNSEERKTCQELDYLSIQLPNLNDRKGDIKDLISHYLQKLSYIKKIQLSPECWSLFEKFPWEGNVKQLERIVSKIVVMAESSYLNPSALLTIIPQLEDKDGQQINISSAQKGDNAEPTIDEISQSIVMGTYDGDVNQHPALSKAIEHLALNYTNNISLAELAATSFVSPSHLSYLFKHHLKSTFKQLLIQVRIEKAKLRLQEDKHCRITEVAFDVGFHDLSHFEKTFKRLVGSCPGKYRK